jgi:hypothetical protein
MFVRQDFSYETLRLSDRLRSQEAARRFQQLEAVREQRRQRRSTQRPTPRHWYLVRRTA